MCKVNQIPRAVAVVFDHDFRIRLASFRRLLHVSDRVTQVATHREPATCRRAAAFPGLKMQQLKKASEPIKAAPRASDALLYGAEGGSGWLLAKLSDERDDLTPLRWVQTSVLDQKLRQLVVLAIKVSCRHFQRLRKAYRGCEGWLVYACFVSADASTAGLLVETDHHPQLVLWYSRALAGRAQAPSEKR